MDENTVQKLEEYLGGFDDLGAAGKFQIGSVVLEKAGADEVLAILQAKDFSVIELTDPANGQTAMRVLERRLSRGQKTVLRVTAGLSDVWQGAFARLANDHLFQDDKTPAHGAVLILIADAALFHTERLERFASSACRI